MRADPLAWCNHRELQRGVPPPCGEQFSKETLIKSASSKAFAATTEARIGPDNDSLRDGFQATSLDSDEVAKLLDACIRPQGHFHGFKIAAMLLLGTAMGFRDEEEESAVPVNISWKSQCLWVAEVFRLARHKDPQLDAAGALPDLLVFSLNLTGLDILQKVENQDNSW
ncbi:TPA: hypothetical protein ACH3X1_016051 [Trebouxia sp. C0004]